MINKDGEEIRLISSGPYMGSKKAWGIKSCTLSHVGVVPRWKTRWFKYWRGLSHSAKLEMIARHNRRGYVHIANITNGRLATDQELEILYSYGLLPEQKRTDRRGLNEL